MLNTKGTATWRGGLKTGSGEVSSQSGALKGTYKFSTRFAEDAEGTNPEELIGAAHAACFSMFLTALLEKENFTVVEITTTADVQLSKDETGPFIRKIKLETQGIVTGIEQQDFEKFAEKAKTNCPISRALHAVPEITLTAVLK